MMNPSNRLTYNEPIRFSIKSVSSNLCALLKKLIISFLVICIAAVCRLADAQINISAPFNDGERWVASTYSGHSGVGTYYAVDFNRENGFPEREIRATHTGIATAFTSVSYGNYVKIVSQDGSLVTLLAHLASKPFDGSRYVSDGDVIGMCGRSGQATGVHCHLEVWYKGARQDVRYILIDDQRINFNSYLNGNVITALRNYTVEGQMARNINLPEVYLRLGDARWWVPDQPNVDYFGGWSNCYLTRQDAIMRLPNCRPRKNFMYRQLNAAPVFVQDPLTYNGRYWIQNGWGVDFLGGWGQVHRVPDRSFSLWDYQGLIF